MQSYFCRKSEEKSILTVICVTKTKLNYSLVSFSLITGMFLNHIGINDAMLSSDIMQCANVIVADNQSV